MSSEALIYPDTQVAVHVGDRVRYVRWDWQDSKFYQKVGTVLAIGHGEVLDVHFPHFARGTNLRTGIGYFRLVECVHQITPVGGTKQNHEFPEPNANPLTWHKGKHGWTTHDGYRRHAHSLNGLLTIPPDSTAIHFQGGIPIGQSVTDRVPALGDD